MKTIDIHVHLLSSEVKFDRFYDKLTIRFFGKKLGIEPKALFADPYHAYTDALTEAVRESKHLSKIALFGVDARVDEDGREIHKDITVCASNEDLFRLYQKNQDVIIPFFSINPKRPDALDLIDKYSELGFKGAKFLQNYWNVDTREERYRPYFEKLKEKSIPLIVHIGSENSIHSYKACEKIEMLDHPLEIGVNVIVAHMAISYEPRKFWRIFSKNPKHFNAEYFKLLQMLQTHPNLYADISALLTPIRAKVLRHLSGQVDVHEKLLFGTDYPVPFSMVFNSYDLPYTKRFAIEKVANPFDRYTKGILEYFPEGHPIYSNYKKILNV
jgi:predicted TIM-barrel fold metal-dependent hydrolase